MAEGQPFDFKFIKVVVKKSNSEKEGKDIYIERDWVQKNNNIPHFANVIKSVSETEGVEITMNCNIDAFNWILAFVKIKTTHDDKMENAGVKESVRMADELDSGLYDKMDEISNENCLNVLVTSYFLQLTWVYEKVWKYYFARNFSEVINSCKISLTNVNPAIVKDIAVRISELQLEELEERKDKFISNVYKCRIEQRMSTQKLYWCSICEKILTKE